MGGNTAGQQPPDRGQRGPKRRGLTAGGGVPIGLAGEGATRHAGTRGAATLPSLPGERPGPPLEPAQGSWREQGEDEAEGRERRAPVGCTAPSRARGEEAHAITRAAGDKARRWGVERAQSGMTRVRRRLGRWDKKGHHELAVLHGACASITSRYSGLLG